MRTRVAVAVLLSALTIGAAPAVSAQAATPMVRSGMAIEVDDTIVTSARCTLGAVLSRTKAITAGHCGDVGQGVFDGSGTRIGTISANQITRRLDIAVIRLAPRSRVVVDTVNWTSGFWRGQKVTKRGVTTGFGSGVITDPRPTVRTAQGFSFAPPFLIRQATVSVRSTLVSQSGDSGAGVRDAAGRVVGILSAGSGSDTLVAPVSALPASLR
ncbi:hypothetical protein EEB19_09125 [Gordonia sp. OPL2]|nr:hypothetical protein EEB19_09125 [Gordonia sp. OPL2]